MRTQNTESIQCSVQDGVWHLCIARPEKRNALTMPMFATIAEALKAADESDEVRSILVTGAGDVFCAGHDLKAFEEWPQKPQDAVPTFLHAIADVRKPVVIAVQGSATGIGVTWLLHADWVVTSADTVLRLPFVDLGIVPEAASTLLLQRAVGLPRARRLLLGGEKFTGAEACEWGLVAEAPPAAEVGARAWERAKFLAAKDPTIVRRIKDWLHPSSEYHQRIDEEVMEINAAVGRRRKAMESTQ
ncbi:Enoyl-CoA hydratase/isomerase [Delftia sp. Cs1-4]|uniref:enoyl-CoA hydratase-related protein n=1 Tax=Delftia sp. (strain Cs1-4) TaxID=742013 RepID=UPI00020E83C0|nr:enoyl-CoA hydratase-related protein [Delftia sp. Cs1-4]AEF90714.1 Enoyl-CoA hydratase/isomerase [Delftia sp. Cs1-4]